MLTVISPAKTLDFSTPPPAGTATRPALLARAAELVADARALDVAQLRQLMAISETTAELNVQRFRSWATPFNRRNAKQAVFAFRGDVYRGLDADTLDAAQLDYAQSHLRILSGLYGVLRPLDLMQPYRLEMGLPFANRGGRNLYEFWGDSVTTALNAQLRRTKSDVVVNLASQEYFRAVRPAVRPAVLSASVIAPVFKDRSGSQYKVISFHAKRARGRMARYIIDRALREPAALREFDCDGYRFSRGDSTVQQPVFTRAAPPAT